MVSPECKITNTIQCTARSIAAQADSNFRLLDASGGKRMREGVGIDGYSRNSFFSKPGNMPMF
jgi:hypothetical protein